MTLDGTTRLEYQVTDPSIEIYEDSFFGIYYTVFFIYNIFYSLDIYNNNKFNASFDFYAESFY